MLMPGNDYITSQILSSQTWLFHLAYNMTLDLDEAKDLLQETVLKILDNKNRFIQGTNFKGWSGVIMKNIFINQRRRSDRIKTENDTPDSESSAFIDLVRNKEADSTPENNLSVNEILAKVNRCPHEHVKPFRMMLAGYSYKEIADRLNLPIGTVKSRIFAARKMLQTSLAGYK